MNTIKWLLLPFGAGHLFVVWARNKFYDKKIFRTEQLPRPVISVGNIQMGGSGKTPLVLALMEVFQQNGKKIGVLTRGYKRQEKENLLIIPGSRDVQTAANLIGDEPALILQNLSNGVLGIAANRYEAGREILKNYPLDVFILDDGFQHRKLYRELDICLIDVSRWRFHPFLFPFSYLRDNQNSLRRADLIILTKFEQHPEKSQKLKLLLEKKYHAPVLNGGFAFHSVVELNDHKPVDLKDIVWQSIAAVCGIANPENFFESLQKLGFNIVFQKSFPDHHPFNLNDLQKIEKKAREAGAERIIVTEKDAVKLRQCLAEAPALAAKILVMRITFVLEGEANLKKMLMARKFIT